MTEGQAEKITRPGFLLGICIPSSMLKLLLIQIKSFARRHVILVVYRSERCYADPHKMPRTCGGC